MPNSEVVHCSLCLRGDTVNSLPILKLQTHQCLHWLQVNFHYWAFIPCTSKRVHQHRSQRRLLLLRCTGVLPTMLHKYHVGSRSSSDNIIFYLVVSHQTKRHHLPIHSCLLYSYYYHRRSSSDRSRGILFHHRRFFYQVNCWQMGTYERVQDTNLVRQVLSKLLKLQSLV